ncbi:MAG TPA: hypothetical protein VIT42_03925 [Microlunatus sp.]
MQRAGGLAGFVIAATYLIGMGLMAAYLVPRGFLDGQASPGDSLAFLLDHQVMLYVWYFVLYLVGGIALVSLVLGVDHRLRPAAAGLSQTAAVIGQIWAGLLLASGLVALVGQRAVVDLAVTDPAMAASTWSSISVIQTALGGGIEIVGAAWILLVSLAGIRSHVIGYGLGGLGLGIAVAGTWTLVPPAVPYAAPLFGLGLIVWFIWMGITLLHPRRLQA